MNPPKIRLVVLGGTITMTKSPTGGIVPTLKAEDLIRGVPGLASVAAIEAASPLQKPGPSLTIEDILDVAEGLRKSLETSDVAGAIVVQGTDTIEETAFLLDCLIRSETPVVVTGARRGRAAAGADGPANLLAAAITAGSASARGKGVLVVLNEEIHAARFVRKSHTLLPSAFGSFPNGAIGVVAEGAAKFFVELRRLPQRFEISKALPQVALHRFSMGEDDRLLKILPSLGFDGIVLEAMGAGHVPATAVETISTLAYRMPVAMTTRTGSGPILQNTYGFPGSETDLRQRGVISAGWLSGVKARLLLGLLLEANACNAKIAETFAFFN